MLLCSSQPLDKLFHTYIIVPEAEEDNSCGDLYWNGNAVKAVYFSASRSESIGRHSRLPIEIILVPG